MAINRGRHSNVTPLKIVVKIILQNFHIKLDEDKLCIKIVEIDAIYNFVALLRIDI
jgi:hypothetical protein